MAYRCLSITGGYVLCLGSAEHRLTAILRPVLGFTNLAAAKVIRKASSQNSGSG